MQHGLAQNMIIAVAGLHLTGEPLNDQLSNNGCVFLKKAQLAPRYAMYLIKGERFDKPGLVRLSEGISGYSFPVELWKMPKIFLADFIQLIPHPLGIGSLELDNGSWVKGFICEANVMDECVNISEFNGWQNYKKNLQ